MVTLTEGKLAVAIAREVLDHGLERSYDGDLLKEVHPLPLPAVFSEKRGLFTTLLTYPDKDLRGCIGFPLPLYPLGEGIARTAWLAAQEDPRFPPVAPPELKRIIVEVSVLTPLERLRNTEPLRVLKEVVVGRDGLYLALGTDSGLLLPEVPVEQGWDTAQFLDGICAKAGLPKGSWKRKEAALWRFRSEIFLEDSPGGTVSLRELTPVSG